MQTKDIDSTMDFSEFVEVMSSFTDLETEKLAEEAEDMTQEISEMKKQLTLKTIVVCELNNRLNELRTVVEKLAEKSDNLDIELIRAKTRQKKVKKAIAKLKSLNASNVNVEVQENDKLKLSRSETSLNLSSSLLRVFVTDENHAIVKNADQQVKAVNLNKSKLQNRETLWKCIAQSKHSKEWKKLF